MGWDFIGHKRLFRIGGAGGSANGAGSNGVVYLRCHASSEKDLSGPLLCFLNLWAQRRTYKDFLALEHDAVEGGQLIEEVPEFGDGGFAVPADFWPSLQYG